MKWETTRATLRPQPDDGFAFATPFAVAGRGTREVIAEFGDQVGWSPEPGSQHRMTIEAQVHHRRRRPKWVAVASFDWWAPPSPDNMDRYLTYRNEPSNRSGIDEGRAPPAS